MTISSEFNQASYTFNGNGATAIFPIFKVLAQTEVLVRAKNTSTGVITTLVLTTDYTVSGIGSDSGATVTLVDPAGDAPTGVQIIFSYNMAETQLTDYQEFDTFPAASHETALDRLTLMIQQMQAEVDRSIKFDPAVANNPELMGTPSANNILSISSDNTGVTYTSLSSIGSYIFPVGTGVLVQNAAGSALARTLTGTSNEITIANGTGVSGNPTFSLPSALTFTGKTITGGSYSTVTITSATINDSIVNESQGADIASASTTDIGAATGNYVNITGVVTITSLGTKTAGARRAVKFTGSLTLTHNATSLILPGAANIVTAAGDTAIFISLGSGNWQCVSFSPAGAFPVNRGGTGVTSATAYSFICGGTTSTGAFQVVAPSSTSGYSYVSQGSSALPTAAARVARTLVTVYTTGTAQTHNFQSNLIEAEIEGIGGGASGGGTSGTAGAGNASAASGGGAGAPVKRVFTAAQCGSSATYTVGALGAAPAAGANNGNDGTDSTIALTGSGTITLTAGKGIKGLAGTNGTLNVVGGAGGTSTNDSLAMTGQSGRNGLVYPSGNLGAGGDGGSSPYGSGGKGANNGNGATAPVAATGFGTGGAGASSAQSATSVAGGAGTGGFWKITERLYS